MEKHESGNSPMSEELKCQQLQMKNTWKNMKLKIH